jgi:hypothetical protein
MSQHREIDEYENASVDLDIVPLVAETALPEQPMRHYLVNIELV